MEDTENQVADNPSEGLTEYQKKKLEAIIEEEEGVTRKVEGFWNTIITALAVGMSLFAIYSAVQPVTTQILRSI